MLITYFKYVESLLVTFQNLPTFPMPCCPILLLRALNLANSLTSLTHCPSVHDSGLVLSTLFPYLGWAVCCFTQFISLADTSISKLEETLQFAFHISYLFRLKIRMSNNLTDMY